MAEAPKPEERVSAVATAVERQAIDEALNATVASSLRPVCVGLALFYALLTAWYLVQYSGAAQTNMSLSTGLLSFGLLAAAVWFERNKLPPWLAHPAAAVIAVAVIFNCLFLLVTVPEARQTTNLMVAQLGFGCLLLSVRWFIGLALISLLGWAWVVGGRREDPDWNHFGLALIEATLFGGLVLLVRIRAYRNIQTLRLRDQILVRDLREANEAARSATRAKSEFLANMSHEIRTPMTAMLGMTELLQMTELDEQQQEFAQTIDRSGKTLLQLVNDILDFSKIESGHFQIESVRFDLATLLEEVREMLAFRAEQKGLALEVALDPSLAQRYRGDPTRIKQVVVNLAGNAIKFTHQGHVRIRAEAAPASDPRSLVAISVEDTGIGIPEDQLDRVFEAFTQADASTTRKYGGTGLGLAISSKLTRLMGGEIELHSDVGKGSVFTLRLPLEAAVRRSTVPPPTLAANQRYDARVLLVEDTEDTQNLALEMLLRMGCTVDIAGDGVQALQRLAGERYDLVLMDCHMPNMNGYAATEEIRRTENGHGKHTIIVALSASVLPEERERCVAVGMDDYVAKPFSQRDLQRVLEQWVGDRAIPEQPRGAA
jgi:signal transduction histidine kinase/ActR/RegA family two-component response regulator